MATAIQTNNRSSLAITKDEIASLAPSDIAKLTFDEMVKVVLASELPVRQLDRIREVEGEMLVRLVYSARSHCRRN